VGKASPRFWALGNLSFMKNGVFRLLVLACACVLGACSSGDSSGDLPDGWDKAARVKGFAQEKCPGSDMDFTGESATFAGGVGNIGVVYQDAHFRCEQNAEGFFKVEGDAVDMLVQPLDMDPKSTAGCDCAYTITFLVEPVPAGAHPTTLYRRWDNITQPNDPVPISTASVTVQ
jgi:hypothetical protein